VFAVTRENEEDKVFAIFNLSNLNQDVELKGDAYVGKYTNLFTDETIEFPQGASVKLAPWEYAIYVK
ncbi:MAG: hypothetical protein PHT92_00165, partial [Bacteroidales bacterium]|nr:hypothetical protein [Bacteroidales bacterium]